MTSKQALELLKKATENNKENTLNSRFGTDCNCAIWVLEQEIFLLNKEIDDMGRVIDDMANVVIEALRKDVKE